MIEIIHCEFQPISFETVVMLVRRIEKIGTALLFKFKEKLTKK